MELEFLQGLKNGEEGLSQEVMDAILQQHTAELAAVRLEGALDSAVARAGGRNVKAIAALLDMEGLKASQDLQADLETALQGLKKEHGYLFEGHRAPPYAPGTGTGAEPGPELPMTLAGALRQKMRK